MRKGVLGAHTAPPIIVQIELLAVLVTSSRARVRVRVSVRNATRFGARRVRTRHAAFRAWVAGESLKWTDGALAPALARRNPRHIKKEMVAFEDIDLSLIKQAFSDTGVNPKLLEVHRSTLYCNVDRTTEMQRILRLGVIHAMELGIARPK